MISIPFTILLLVFLFGKETQNRVKFVLRKTVIHQHNVAKIEDKKSLQLLYNCLPEFVVHDLCKENINSWQARRFDGVTIFCMDVVNFTKLSSNLSPQDVIALLNEIFSEFDNLCINGIEKYQTIGDAYQAGAGCPYSCKDHAIKMINFSREVLKVTKKFNEHHDIDIIMSNNNHNLKPNISLLQKDISEPYNIHDIYDEESLVKQSSLDQTESLTQISINHHNQVGNGNNHSFKRKFSLFSDNLLKHKTNEMNTIDNISPSLRKSQSISNTNLPTSPFTPFDMKPLGSDDNKIKKSISNSNLIKIFPHVDIRIGVYSGYVFAGVIGGQKRFKFEVFGDAIDKATLLESHGVVNRIHVSESVYQQTCNEVKYELLEKTIKEIGFNGYLVVYENK
jgi:class 3 adenylate cyclase